MPSASRFKQAGAGQVWSGSTRPACWKPSLNAVTRLRVFPLTMKRLKASMHPPAGWAFRESSSPKNLLREKAAVYRQRVPGDHGGSRAGEKQDRGSYFLRFGEALKRCHRLD